MRISKSKVYELALSAIKEEHIQNFLKQYIPNVFPIMTEYGGQFLINGMILNSIAKKYPAKSFALLEWPSIDQFIKINQDQRIVPLIEKRNQYLVEMGTLILKQFMVEMGTLILKQFKQINNKLF